MQYFVFVMYLPIFRGPQTFISLLILDADSKYSFLSYLDDPLHSYLIRIFSMITKELQSSATVVTNEQVKY